MRIGLMVVVVVGGLVAASTSFAQMVTPLASAPAPRTAGGLTLGIAPQMPTEVTKEGWCVATATPATPTDPGQAEVAAHRACLDTLIPKRPVPLLQTPGSFFVGYAVGSKASQFVYGPQVGIGAAVLFPLRRPSLQWRLAPALGADGADRAWTFSLPSEMSIAADLAVSLTANLASFTFPNAPSGTTASSATTGATEPTFNAAFYVAPQVGWEWWDETAKRVMFSVGVMAGYINTQATGAAFAVGLQPGLVAQF
jgi:hypothetical protein